MNAATLPSIDRASAGTDARRMSQRAALDLTDRDLVRVITINTHRGQGPKIRYLLDGADASTAEHVRLLHDTRVYAYHIADWMRQHRDRYHVVALQEVLHGVLGLRGPSLRGRCLQRDYYRVIGEYQGSVSHRVGFAGFRYENLLLSRLAETERVRIQSLLPCPVFRLAACGFTLAAYHWQGRMVWIGNTHLHAYNPRARARQAASIARQLRSLGDQPVLFLGDLNTVPPGCKDGDFPHGDRDVRSYRGDRTLEILGSAGLRTIAYRDDERFWTYPTGAPNRTLDYILFSRHWDVEEYRVVDEFALSDHYPVEAAFRLRP